MGHKFTLVLSREITDDESAVLQEAGHSSAIVGRGTLPTNADVTVTKMDFDDTISPSLAEAIESALEAVKKVPDLGVPGLSVPAQPAQTADGESAEAAAAESKVVAGEVLEESAEKDPATKKDRTKKASAAKASARSENVPAEHGAAESLEVAEPD